MRHATAYSESRDGWMPIHTHGQMLRNSVCRLLHSLAIHWDDRNREKPLGMLHQKGLEGVFQISVDSTVPLERKGTTSMDRSDVEGRILGC
jgi:hypothetical protein